MDVLNQYILDHSTPASETLQWLERETHYRTIHPRMLTDEPMGTFLTLWVQTQRPKRILEIGTFTGYGSICLAKGLEKGGMLDTIEIFDEHQDLIEEAFRRSGLESRIHLYIGDAKDIIVSLQEQGYTYDLVYMDANKREYCEYYRLVKPLIPVGGILLADNVLWDGKVADSQSQDAQTKGLRAFNNLVQSDPDVVNVLLPLRDGLTVCRKIS